MESQHSIGMITKCVEQLGRSGVGDSYKVQQISTGDFFTIKKVLIFSYEASDDTHKERIMYDMTLTAFLDHPNIMKCPTICLIIIKYKTSPAFPK
jgi:hypothetical protein